MNGILNRNTKPAFRADDIIGGTAATIEPTALTQAALAAPTTITLPVSRIAGGVVQRCSERGTRAMTRNLGNGYTLTMVG